MRYLLLLILISGCGENQANRYSAQRKVCIEAGYPKFMYSGKDVICQKLEHGSDVLKPALELTGKAKEDK